MATLLDFTLVDTTVANPDGTRSTTFTGAAVTAGPGSTALGQYEKALALDGTGGASVDLSGADPDRGRFCVEVVFSVPAVPAAEQALVDCSLLPFTLSVLPGASATSYALDARVLPAAGAKAGATTGFTRGLAPNTWYTATLVYDVDTLAVYVDHALLSVHAYPHGALSPAGSATLTIGSTTSQSARFTGAVAAVRWQDDVPAALQALLDESRAGGEWHISYKYESLPASLDLGVARSAVSWDTAPQAWVQHYDHGLIMCADNAGVAFEMHGDIWATYSSLVDTSPLGALVSDEMNTRGAGGRKSLFTQGGIYWSAATGSVPVVGHLYLDYERMGDSSSVLGLPTQLATAVPNGLEQVFQGGRMYVRNANGAAHEVHGDILAHYLATGGPAAWGFPVTDESDVLADGRSIGRFSEFEGCTIYWTPQTGSHEVHGDIREMYRSLQGPAGELGFPTCDEADIPGAAAPARYNTFQNGSLLWYGSFESLVVARPFELFFGRIDTVESEGFAMGENDLYFRLTIKQGAATVFDHRFPDSGDFGGHDVMDWNFTVPVTFVPNTTDPVSFCLDVWDSDDGAPFGGGDDHLGMWNHDLTIADAWGLRTNGGILNSGHFDHINNVSASVKPKVDVNALTPGQKWWGVQNQGTDPITYPEYAAAFEDVDEQPEAGDVTDWLDKAFYDIAVEHVAKNGNCFGMSLEGINALKGRSLFSLPLDRFTDWNTVSHEFNVKHCYQVGAGPIWWFVGEFLSGRTHDPKNVFQATADAHARGDNPVLCLAQNADFSGAPHCIMPIAWNTSVQPWEMTVCDPNFVATTRTLTVDPVANTFHYDGGNVYTGSADSGGRLHYMPYHLLSSPQDTPVWEAVLLLLAGTIVLLGSDAATLSLQDGQGNDLDAFGARARQLAAGRGSLDDFFFGVKGFDEGGQPAGSPQTLQTVLGKTISSTISSTIGKVVGTATQTVNRGVLETILDRPDGPIAGELLMRRGRSIQDVVLDRRRPIPVIVHQPLATIAVAARGLAPLATQLATEPALRKAVGTRTALAVAADQSVAAQLTEQSTAALQAVIRAATGEDFVHSVRGLQDGTFEYALARGLTEIHVSTPLAQGEHTSLQTTALGTSKAVLTLTAQHAKTATIRVVNRLGLGTDRIAVELSGVPLGGDTSVQLNAKPGLGGLELAASAGATVQVRIDAVVDGRSISNQFDVGMQNAAMRIDPASMLTQPGLQVSHVDHLFGPAVGKLLVQPKG